MLHTLNLSLNYANTQVNVRGIISKGGTISIFTGDSGMNGWPGGPLVAYDLGDNEPYLAGNVSWECNPADRNVTQLSCVFGNVAFLRPFLNAEGARP